MDTDNEVSLLASSTCLFPILLLYLDLGLAEIMDTHTEFRVKEDANKIQKSWLHLDDFFVRISTMSAYVADISSSKGTAYHGT